jgi:C1A family cysteine protease
MRRILVSIKKAVLPDSVNLNPMFEKLGLYTRPQGSRGTCSVFTVVGVLEYALASATGKGNILSVEFLNWASHKAANRNVDGAFFSELWDGYVEYGICAESDLPYLPEFNIDLQPSEIVLEKAKQMKSTPLQMRWIKEWDPNTGLTDDQFVEIKETLVNQSPVCGGFRWPKEAKWENDVLQMCPSSEVFDGHSIILSGYKDNPTQSGGGVFIIRNSGGHSRDGYMPYEYAKAYMNDALWIKG